MNNSDPVLKPITESNVDLTLTDETTNSELGCMIIQSLLTSNGIKSSIVLTDNEISILKQIISINPTFLNDINACVLEIIKDGKIDTMDIPPLIQIIKNLYVLCHQNIKINAHDLVNAIGSILKYVLQVILVKNNLSTPELIQSCNAIINLVVDMIQLQSSLKTKTCFFKLC
jgi:hypothetical protein